MKKYRVISDNLDWLRIPKNAIIEEVGTNMYVFYTNLNLPALIGSTEMYQALISRPEWFSEIKEEPDKFNFTLSDMVDFGRYVQGLTKAPVVSIDAHVLNKWAQRVRTVVGGVSKAEDSPKEEIITKKELIDFANRTCEHMRKFKSWAEQQAAFANEIESPKEELQAPPIEFKGMRMSENERLAWEILNPAVKEIALKFKTSADKKEEPKEFTRADLFKLAMFIGNAQWWNPRNSLIEAKNFPGTPADNVIDLFITTKREHE